MKTPEQNNRFNVFENNFDTFKILSDNSFDIISILDKEGKILFENLATERILGYKAGERIGQKVFNYVHPEDIQEVAEKFQKLVLDPKGMTVVEFRFKHQNGSWIWLETSGQNFINNQNIKGIITNSRDITERKEQEKKLQDKSKEISLKTKILEQIIDTIPSPVFVKDKDLRYSICNSAFAKNVIGKTKVEITGKTVYDISPAELAIKYYESDLKFKEEGSNYHEYETQVLFSDNKYHDVLLYKAALKDSENNFSGIVGIMLDITERKKIEQHIQDQNERLEVSDKRYKKAQEIGKVGNWEYDIQNDLFWGSDETKRIYGFDSESELFTNETVLSCIPEKERVNKTLEDLIHKNIPYNIEFEILPVNSTEIKIIHSVAELYKDENGKPIKVVGIIHEITEKKKTEKELKISEEKFRLIFEKNASAMLIASPDTTILMVNEFFIQVTGYSKEELIGEKWPKLIADSDLDRLLEYNSKRRDINAKLPEKYEFSYKHKSGEIRHGIVSIAFFPGNKNTIVSVIDITEKKQAELQLENFAKELNQLNNDKDRFIQILAHDLKNPFTSLFGFSDLLLRNIRKYDTEKTERMIKTIHDTANQTYNLLEDLLLWSKSQSGSLSFEPQNVLFLDVCNLLLRNFKENDKNISINCFGEVKTIITVDLNMFKTILRNLITNAIKFSHKNQTINIFAEKENDEFIITVSDTGVGMAESDINRLWKITEQFSTKGTEGEKGTGFGLFLCKEFVEKHGGRIWVENQKGKGSDFKFTIPVVKK
ncbi:MAG: PAS domain S-box protein [Bacteroidales bacterium]|nr:PAS domain S-box protein [Bacteroidales bacterium]